MPIVKRTCRVCGKQYEACHTPNWGVLRWRDIACSRECAEIYFARVEAERAKNEETRPEHEK